MLVAALIFTKKAGGKRQDLDVARYILALSKLMLTVSLETKKIKSVAK